MREKALSRAVALEREYETDKYIVAVDPAFLTSLLMLAWMDGAAAQAAEDAEEVARALK